MAETVSLLTETAVAKAVRVPDGLVMVPVAELTEPPDGLRALMSKA